MENKKNFKVDLGSFNIVAAIVSIAGVILGLLTGEWLGGLTVFGFVAMAVLYFVVSYYASKLRQTNKSLELEVGKLNQKLDNEREIAATAQKQYSEEVLKNRDLQNSVNHLMAKIEAVDAAPVAETKTKTASKKKTKKSLGEIKSEVKDISGTLQK